jgi:hypothetical protein
VHLPADEGLPPIVDWVPVMIVRRRSRFIMTDGADMSAATCSSLTGWLSSRGLWSASPRVVTVWPLRRVAPRRRLGVRAGSSKSISTVHRRFGMVITAVPSLRFNAGRTPDDVER